MATPRGYPSRAASPSGSLLIRDVEVQGRHARRRWRRGSRSLNRALPDAELDNFVDRLVTRIASFDKWAIANAKRLVNAAILPPDVEIRAGWDAFLASFRRPTAQERIKDLLEQGFQKPGDLENRLGFYLGGLDLKSEP